MNQKPTAYNNRLGVKGWMYAGRYSFERYLYLGHRLSGLGLLAYMILHIVETANRAIIVSVCGFPIDFLPSHQKLHRPFALGTNVAIGFDPRSNHPLYFIGFFFDFLDRGDEAVLGVSKKLRSSREGVEPELGSLEVERRRDQSRCVESLLQREIGSLMGV